MIHLQSRCDQGNQKSTKMAFMRQEVSSEFVPIIKISAAERLTSTTCEIKQVRRIDAESEIHQKLRRFWTWLEKLHSECSNVVTDEFRQLGQEEHNFVALQLFE